MEGQGTKQPSSHSPNDEGASPGQDSLDSYAKKSSVSSGGRSRNKKEFLRKFIDSEILTTYLTEWFDEIAEKSSQKLPPFDVPFELIDLQKFEYALEGIPFQQLIRMPNTFNASTSNAVEANAFLALEDFLHASVKGLWEAFWEENEVLPFHVACLYDKNLKFYQAEKAISNGKLSGLCATAILLKNPRHPHGKWEDILEIALLRPDIGKETDINSFNSILGEALFYAIRILLSRSLGKRNFDHVENSVSVLLVDSQHGGVVKVEGDLSKVECDVNNVYECASEWVKNHLRIAISPIDRIWNKLGNANWGDIGALQILFATFFAITQYAGMPKHSIEDLANDHSSRIHTRRSERHFLDSITNGNGLFRLQQRSISPEIVEIHDESIHLEPEESEKMTKLEVGYVVWLEDSNRQNGYQINEVLNDGDATFYIALPMDDTGSHVHSHVYLYIGSHPSQVEPGLEDMELWYQVQRQTKVLTIMKHKGVSDKYLPQLVVSGRVIQSDQCPGGNPVLVTSPVGRTVADVARFGEFGPNEAIKCCHDCLSALSTSSGVGIRHGDIRPENIISVKSNFRQDYYVLIGWGHAILEERDRAALNLHFSSTYALQEGKLCSASDAESLVYLLYFSIGGECPELDSVEGALEWREKAWSKRTIQQKLGEISAVLKAFADYVDSLCGTPYPMDYGIWIRRLRSHIYEDDHGKEIDRSS